MTKGFKAWLVITLLLTCPGISTAQTVPVLHLGFSGGGVGSDLLKVTERASLWRKHGLDVRPIYLTNERHFMAQTLSAGDIGLTGFDVTAMLSLSSWCAKQSILPPTSKEKQSRSAAMVQARISSPASSFAIGNSIPTRTCGYCNPATHPVGSLL